MCRTDGDDTGACGCGKNTVRMRMVDIVVMTCCLGDSGVILGSSVDIIMY